MIALAVPSLISRCLGKMKSTALLLIMIPARNNRQSIGINSIDKPVGLIDTTRPESVQVLL